MEYQWKEGVLEDPVLEEELLDWLIHKDLYEGKHESLVDLTIY